MSDVAIRVEGLGKRYRIGAREEMYKTLRDSLADALLSPVRRVARALRGEPAAGPSETLWALKDLTLTVTHGEVLGIIGRNGAGKSTLLKVLSRITEPTTGFAEIEGRVGSLLEVGTGFHPELTGRENIFLNGAVLGMRKAEIARKFDEIVAFAEVGRFIDTPVKHYSSGMYLRLAFAVAAHLEPDVLIVDEVLAVGDASFQKKCLGKMGEVAEGGRTVLLVSHNMEAIMGLCSRAVWLDAGAKVADGPAGDVVRDYLTSGGAAAVSSTALEKRTDRLGDGRMRFTGFHLRDRAGNVVDAAIAGDPVEFVITYALSQDVVPNVTVWATIVDGFERDLICFWTRLTGHDIDRLTPDRQFVCHVPRLPLVPGTYAVRLGANAKDGKLDYVVNAATLEVAPGDFFGTGRSLTAIGDFLCDHSWSVEDAGGQRTH
jgi:lipopolysaccharide transport system ATP-binding protein